MVTIALVKILYQLRGLLCRSLTKCTSIERPNWSFYCLVLGDLVLLWFFLCCCPSFSFWILRFILIELYWLLVRKENSARGRIIIPARKEATLYLFLGLESASHKFRFVCFHFITKYILSTALHQQFKFNNLRQICIHKYWIYSCSNGSPASCCICMIDLSNIKACYIHPILIHTHRHTHTHIYMNSIGGSHRS